MNSDQPILSLSNISSVIALAVGILYVIQIGFLKARTNKANIYFTGYLLNLTFIILFFFLNDVKVSMVKFLIPLLVTSVLLIGPLLWIYIDRLTQSSQRHKIKKHILPAISLGGFVLLLELGLFIFKSKEAREIIAEIMKVVTISAITIVFMIQNAYYIWKSYQLYQAHQNYVSDVFSYSEQVDLKWLKVLILGYLFFIIGLILVNLIKGTVSDVSFDLLMVVYIVYSGIHALNQKEVIPKELITIENTDVKILGDVMKQETHREDIDRSEEKLESIEKENKELFGKIKQGLIEKLDEEKLYRDQDLTIYKLAKILNTNSKYLSVIINKEFGKNFVNFINEYRVEEAKINLLQDVKHSLTIEAHGQNVGFKSKSSFNVAFKKLTGYTPTEYIRANTSQTV